MKKTLEQKRRAAKARAQRLRKELEEKSKNIESPVPIITEVVKDKTEKDTNPNAQANKEHPPQQGTPKRKAKRMITVLLYVIGIIFAVTLGLALKSGSLTWHFWWSIATLIIAVLGVAVYIQAYVIEPRETGKKEAVIPEVVKSERPELFYVLTLDPITLGQPVTARLTVTNTSKTTAYRINICPSINLVLVPFEGPIKYETPDIASHRTLPDLPPYNPSGIPPAVMAFNSQDKVMTRERIDLLNSGRGLLFLFGRGQYEDESGKRYPVKFCFMYDKTIPGMVRLCPTEYLPREDDPKKDCPYPD